MRKLTRKNLDELAKVMPVLNEVQQSNYWGGAKGDANEPYSQYEFWAMLDNDQWTTGGYVAGMGFVAGEAVVTGIYNNTPNNDDSGSNSPWGLLSFSLGIAGDIGSGSQSILDDRGKYMPNGKIYTLKTPITVRLPIGVMDTNAQVLNAVRVGGKWMGVLGNIFSAADVIGEFSSGNYAAGSAKGGVALLQAGCTFIPGVGWAISIGIGVADVIWGDDLYNSLK